MQDTTRIVRELSNQACGAADWLERAWASALEPSAIAFRAAYASVHRRLGSRALELCAPARELAALSRPHWTLTDWVRLGLTLTALEATPEREHAALVLRLFEGGEIGEQASVLRTLTLLPEPARFLDTGLQACRTNALSVFEAIACENAFPAAHFPDLNFNQMVLKAVFLEVSIRRIESLSARITPELQRMARDYASERRAAGRTVPTDIDYLLEEKP